jgi:hypothetical protein
MELVRLVRPESNFPHPAIGGQAVNHPDTDIADAIIAGIGGADNSTEQMAAVVTNLERAGFKIIPRARYEALAAAAESVIEASCDCECGACDVCVTAAALRAAGIETEG